MIQSLLLIGPFNGSLTLLQAELSSLNPVHTPLYRDAVMALKSNPYLSQCTILLDLYVEDEDGLSALMQLKSQFPLIEMIVLAPSLNPDWAIASLGMGAYAYLQYDVNPRIIQTYLSQIQSQFNWFEKMEAAIKRKLLSQMDARLGIAMELLAKRRHQGKTLTSNELSVLLMSSEHHNTPQLLNQLSNYTPAHKGHATLLLVEDEPMVADSLLSLIKTGISCDIHHVGSARDALIPLTPAPQVIILDIGLPDGCGIDLITPLRNQYPHTEILMLTAYKELDMITRCFKYGASDYLQKPFRAYQVQQVVAKALQRHIYQTFIPATISELSMSQQHRIEDRLLLLSEWINWRQEKNRAVNTRELAVLIPAIQSMPIAQTDNWYDSALFADGLPNFFANHCPECMIPAQTDLAFLKDQS